MQSKARKQLDGMMKGKDKCKTSILATSKKAQKIENEKLEF